MNETAIARMTVTVIMMEIAKVIVIVRMTVIAVVTVTMDPVLIVNVIAAQIMESPNISFLA